MKFLIWIIIGTSAFTVLSQNTSKILATSDIASYTAESLSADGKQLYDGREARIRETRTALLSRMAGETLLDLEAVTRSSTQAELIAQQKAKVADPTDAEIQDVYVANKRQLENKSLAEVRKIIVNFLRQDSEQKAIDAYLETLKAKYRFVAGKDVNSPVLRLTDVLFSIAGKPLLTSEFESKNKVQLNDALADIMDDII